MEKINNVRFDKEILTGAFRLNYESSIFDTFLLEDGRVLRLLRESERFTNFLAKEVCKSYPDFFQNELRGKLEALSDCGLKEVLTPEEIHKDDDGYIKGYTYHMPSATDFNAIYESDKESFPSLLQELYHVVGKAHKQEIKFPNLGSDNSVFYDNGSGQFLFAPCDLLQIGHYMSFDRSLLLDPQSNSVLSQKAFQTESERLVTDNYDNAALYFMALNSCLGMNVPQELRRRYNESVSRWNPNPCFINTNPTEKDIAYFGHSFRDLRVAIKRFIKDTGLEGTGIDDDLLRIYCDCKKGALGRLFQTGRVPSPKNVIKVLSRKNI